MDTDEATVYADQPGFPPIADAIARIKAADLTVWHNGYRYDVILINRLYPGTIDPTKVFDTLVGARLMNPEAETNALEEWGRALGILKGEYTGDFQSFTPELVKYAAQDVVVTRALYKHVMKGLEGWGSSVETEQRFAWLMSLQEENGFHLDVAAAQELDATFRGELEASAASLRDVFTPKWARTEKEPFVPKSDNKRMGYVAGAPVTKVALQTFNPGSRRQVAQRLQGLGWRPKTFNKDGSPKVDDDILASLPWPEASRLSSYYAIKKKLEQISDGQSAWLKWVKPDGRVHGRVNTVGAAPGRCSHSKPNMAQVNKKDLRMRAVWKPRPGWKLVGIDGEGLQARGLAHYLAKYDGGAYANKIVNGDKKLKTDEHASNLQALPFLNEAYKAEGDVYKKARDGAKTCLYCVLFGGQDEKLGRTLKEALRDAELPMPKMADRSIGKLARKALFRAIVGFEDLATAIRETVDKQGYLRGLDGRHIFIRSKHSALVFLMQGMEAAVMKLAACIFYYEECAKRGWVHGRDFAFVCQIHDEQQVECRPEIADELGAVYAQCITEAGLRLNIRCPLAGDFAVGDDWRATH